MLGSIISSNQDLTFRQLKIYYDEQKLTFKVDFTMSLELLTEDGNYNYAAYLLSDSNGCSIKVAKYAGTDRVDLIDNQEYGLCSLFKATEAVLERLNIENRTFTKITSFRRKEIHQLEPRSLREAVINAIVHNDYTSEVPPKFELFSDRLEITSTGGIPPELTEDEFFGGVSKPVNKILMRVFKDVEIVEQSGTGIPRILEEYNKDSYEISDNFIRVRFPFAKSFDAIAQTANKDIGDNSNE